MGKKNKLYGCSLAHTAQAEGVQEYDAGEVTGNWRKLHNEELCNKYCSLNIIQVITWRMMR
jgi:hypothetical protein